MYDVIVIGGGPAGQSAALFTSKAGMNTLLIDNSKGLTQRAWIRNHYGVKDISGADLVAAGREQAKQFGTEMVEGQVTGLIETDGRFTVETENGKNYAGGQIILATGANQKLAESAGLKVKEGTEPYVKTIIDVDQTGKTSHPGIWACGTAAGVSVHTIITAGDGAKTAVNLLSERSGKRYVDHDAL